MLGVSSVQVSQLKQQLDDPLPMIGKKGRSFLFDIHAVHEWDIRRRIKSELAGTKGQGADTSEVLSFHAEKTRLTRAQADARELENRQKRGELAEISVLSETLSITLNSVAAKLDSIPAEMRRKCPHLSQADIDEITRVITSIRNTIDGSEIDLPFDAEIPAEGST